MTSNVLRREFSSHIRTADTARRKAAEKPNGVVERIKRTQEEQEATEKESEAVNARRNELKTQAQNRKKRLVKLKAEVVRLEKIVEKEPDVADTAEMIERRVRLFVRQGDATNLLTPIIFLVRASASASGHNGRLPDPAGQTKRDYPGNFSAQGTSG